MEPTLVDGDDILAIRPWRAVRPGDIVVLLDPRDSTRWLVKRVQGREGEWVELRGDNAEASTDSRHFGPRPASELKYIAVFPRSSGK
ncbi:MAG: S26 family signal peptidase [Acidobacteria bacterium]|nr:S26 family signal peptidase [Acidobacteriota bacterium]